MMYFDKNIIFDKLIRLNKSLIIIFCLIFFCGLLMLYSASGGNVRPWAIRQFIYFILFFPISIIISLIDIKFWYKISYIIYFCGLFLLILVEIVGHKSMGATRWINLGFIRIQPSEIMKICMIIGLAKYFFQKNLNEIKKNKNLILPILMYILPFILILKQPNLGTALILSAIFVLILFFVGVQFYKFVICFFLVLISIPIVWNYGMHTNKKKY